MKLNLGTFPVGSVVQVEFGPYYDSTGAESVSFTPSPPTAHCYLLGSTDTDQGVVTLTVSGNVLRGSMDTTGFAAGQYVVRITAGAVNNGASFVGESQGFTVGLVQSSVPVGQCFDALTTIPAIYAVDSGGTIPVPDQRFLREYVYAGLGVNGYPTWTASGNIGYSGTYWQVAIGSTVYQSSVAGPSPANLLYQNLVGPGGSQILLSASGPITALNSAPSTVPGSVAAGSVQAVTSQLAFGADGFVKASLWGIFGTAITGTAAYLASAFSKLFNVAPTSQNLTVASNNQTGDNYARIGAPRTGTTSMDLGVVITSIFDTIPEINVSGFPFGGTTLTANFVHSGTLTWNYNVLVSGQTVNGATIAYSLSTNTWTINIYDGTVGGSVVLTFTSTVTVPWNIRTWTRTYGTLSYPAIPITTQPIPADTIAATAAVTSLLGTPTSTLGTVSGDIAAVQTAVGEVSGGGNTVNI